MENDSQQLIEELESKIESLNYQVDGRDDEIDELKSEVDSLESQVKDLELEVENSDDILVQTMEYIGISATDAKMALNSHTPVEQLATLIQNKLRW